MRRETRLLMGMPVTIEIVDDAPACLIGQGFAYFTAVDERFSLWKLESEISALNRGEIAMPGVSAEMRAVLELAERTKRETDGYFDIRRADGSLDPSGIVKGWAIRNVATMIAQAGVRNFFVDAGGDIQSKGVNAAGEDWTVGIRNPFDETEIIKAVKPQGSGIATSGNYVRGEHIYDPHRARRPAAGVVSLTVIGPDVLEADRFATAAFAMGRAGIHFIERSPGLEGYLVDDTGVATETSGFGAFVTQ